MFCTNCGKEVKDDISFCPECGTLIKRSPSHQKDDSGLSYTSINSANDASHSDSEYNQTNANKLGMKWHYVMILYSLVAGFVNFYVLLQVGQVSQYIPSNQKALYTAVSIWSFIVGIYGLFVAYSLYAYKSRGPKMIVWFFYIAIVASLISNPISITHWISIGIICLIMRYTKKYYQERRALFIN